MRIPFALRTPGRSRPALALLLALAAYPLAWHLDASVYDGFRHLFLDGFFWLRGPAPATDRVVVLSVNEDTFEFLGKNWPPGEADFARAIENVKADGAAAVGLDFIVGDPYAAGPATSAELALAAALARPPVSVCATKLEHFARVESVNGARQVNRYTVVTTPRRVYDGAYLPGMISTSADADGAIRRHFPVVPTTGGTGELSFVAALVLSADRITAEVGAVRRLSDGRLAVGRRVVPADRRGRFLINYNGPAGSVPAVPFYAALTGGFPAGTFRDRIVLVGPGHREFHDEFPHPYQGAPGDPTGMAMPGVEVMANAVDTLVRDRPLEEASRPLVALAASLLVFPVARAALSSGLLAGLSLVAASLPAALALASLLFTTRGFFLNPFPALACALLVFPAALALKARLLESDARKVRALFARFVEPAVAERVVAEGVAYPLAGRHLEVCVAFGDVRGFTAYSAGQPPERVFEDLNALFEIVVDEVFRSGGMIDKFIGDCVMIVFGAPVPMEGKEVRAVATLLAIRARIRDLNVRRAAEGRPPMELGFGVSTGVAMCGNLGAARRMEYTSVGETVNLASRLQGKAGPGEIVLSEEVAARVGERFGPLRSETFELKGIAAPVAARVLPAGDEGDPAGP